MPSDPRRVQSGRGAKHKIVPDRNPLSGGGGLDYDHGHRVQEERVRENLGNAEYWGENGHGKSPTLNLRKASCPASKNRCNQCNRIGHLQDFCTREKPEGASEDSNKTTVNGDYGQSSKTEMTKTSGNVRGISQYNQKPM